MKERRSMRTCKTLVGVLAATGMAMFLVSCTSLNNLNPPCVYVVSPNSASFNGSGGSATIAVSAATGCQWVAKSSSSWLSISGVGSGNGDGKVTYNVLENPDEA